METTRSDAPTMSPETGPELPLFPLNTVLFPGGPLSLRIFEPRYLDMVSACLKSGTGFGVVLIRDGAEAGPVTAFHRMGTLVRIVDFDRLDDGTLGITCLGTERFRVLSHRLRPDRLLVGRVQRLVETPPQAVPEVHRDLVDLLAGLLGRPEADAYRGLLQEDWDSAAWISGRLAELLPVELADRQVLLELDDPDRRLDLIHTLLQEQHQS